MWWLWAVFVVASASQTAFIYWLHLPEDLWDIDAHGLVMTGVAGFLGFLVGCPTEAGGARTAGGAKKGKNKKHHTVDWIRVVAASGLFAFVVGSAVMSWDWCPEHVYLIVYYTIISVLFMLSVMACQWSEHVPNAMMMALSVAPFSLLFLGSVLKSPYLDVATSMFAFACLYLYLTNHRNVDVSCSLCSAYLLSCFLVYGLLASPEALKQEYKAPFFRVIGANDTVLKYTAAGLLLIVWLFRSLVAADSGQVETTTV